MAEKERSLWDKMTKPDPKKVSEQAKKFEVKSDMPNVKITDTSKGVDAGELGKPWHEQLTKK